MRSGFLFFEAEKFLLVLRIEAYKNSAVLKKNAELRKGRLIGGKRLYSRSEILAEPIGNGRVFRLYSCSQEDDREIQKGILS